MSSADSTTPESQEPSSAWTTWHPYLAAAFPVMALYAYHPAEVRPWEAFLCIAVLMLIAGIAKCVAERFFPDKARAALAVSWIIGMMFAYRQLFAMTRQYGLPIISEHACLLVVWAVAATAGVIWIWKRGDDPKLSTLATLFALFLIGQSTLAVGAAWVTHPTALGAALEPSREPIELDPTVEKPDIYYLVFDRYGSSAVLEEHFQHDNQPFLNELRERGFYVAEDSCANYPRTVMSMASSLNMQYLDDRAGLKFLYRPQLRRHRVGRLLKSQGYRYHHLGCLLDGLRDNEYADEQYRFSLLPTEFSDVLFHLTPLGQFVTGTPHSQRAPDRIAEVKRIAADASDQPKFVYAHFLIPHPPWKHGRDGGPPDDSDKPDSERYIDQLEYANASILDMVDQIRAQAKRPPIIIIQADEGPEMRYTNIELNGVEDHMRFRAPILCAVHLPDGRNKALYSDVTPVNLFRIIFRECFHAQMPLLEDKVYYWDHANRCGKPDFDYQVKLIEATSVVWPHRETAESQESQRDANE